MGRISTGLGTVWESALTLGFFDVFFLFARSSALVFERVRRVVGGEEHAERERNPARVGRSNQSYPSELWSLDGALGHWKCHDSDTGDACEYAGAMYEQGAFTAHVLPTYREQGVLREVPSCAINAPCESRLEASLRGAAACHFAGYYDSAKFVASSRADVVLGTRSPSSRVVANANATLGGTSLVACVHGGGQHGFIDSVEVRTIVFASVALACVAVGFNTLRGKRSGRRSERGYNAVDEPVPAI